MTSKLSNSSGKKNYLPVIFLCLGYFLCSGLPVHGANREQDSLALHFQTITLDQLFKYLTEKSDYLFTYPEELASDERTYSIDYEGRSIPELMEYLKKRLPIDYRIVNKNVSIIKDSDRKLGSIEWQQGIQVSGTVTDLEGLPLPGVNIIEKGTNRGTATDINGNFSFQSARDTLFLEFSYIGYKTVEQRYLSSQTGLRISLEEDQTVMDDLVVIGYGTSKKDRFTGSVTSIDNSDIKEYANVVNVDQAMVGKLAGVSILTNARNPGDGNTITIRGSGSITRDANPLIVVDGFPLAEGSSLNVLNPNDITSIDVIKDAASSAIYGSRAANGLIMITTRKGKKETFSVEVSSAYGLQERSGSYDLLNAYDAAVFFRDGRNNAYLKNHPNVSIDDTEEERVNNGANVRELVLDYTIPYLNGEPGLMDFNWEDAVYRVGEIQNHYLNVSGGTKRTDYSVSLGYSDEEGIVISADQKRYTTNLNLNTDINDYLRYGVHINGYYAQRGLTNGGNNYRFPIDPAGRAMVYMYPFFSAYDANDPTGYSIEAQIRANRPYNANMQENPVAMAELSKYDREAFQTFGNTYFELEPLEDLVLKSSLGYFYETNFTDHFAPMVTGSYRRLITERDPQQGWESRSDKGDILLENTVNYYKEISKHSFDLLGGHSYQKSRAKSLTVYGYDFPNDIIDNVAGSTTQTAEVGRSRWVQISYFGRLMYSYDDTYFLTGSLRSDGSSRFGRDNRWGTFGSLSAGWVLSNENFFPENKVLTYSKFRYSWGETGNNQIGNYSQFASISTGRDYPYDGSLGVGAAPSSAPSYALSWETNTSNNFGVDLAFFNRINVSVDYYQAKISDLLLDRPVPLHTGFNSSLQNIGEMENRGWEFEIAANALRIADLSIGLDANLTTNQNEILSLGGTDEMFEGGNQRFITRVGESLGNLYGYKITGLLTSQEEVAEYLSRKSTTLSAEVGDYIFQDTDGNDIIDAEDRVLLGDYKPEVTYGFGLNLRFKGFDFLANFNGTLGRVAFDEMTSRYLEYGEAFTNTNYHYFNNYWDPVRNPDGFLAPPDAYGNTASRAASRNPTNYNVLDADYLRLRSLQLGYSLPASLISNLHMNSFRVYVAANNLYTWSDYRGMNPDGGDTGNPLNRGHVHGTTAVPRIISAGLNVSF